MNGKYLYLTIDVLSLIFPLLFSFHPRYKFYQKWKFLWPAILGPAIIFIVWDSWFTGMGVWGFNPRYVTGIYFLNLPIEEVLFFMCVPYACTFTYECVSLLMQRPGPKRAIDAATPWISYLLSALLICLAVVYFHQWYPIVTFLSLACFVLMLQWFFRPAYLGKFYAAFIFILLPFFIVNGVLTGTGPEEPVVWYNNSENMGIRIGTIPVEDVFYGMLLILMNVSIFESLQRRTKK